MQTLMAPRWAKLAYKLQCFLELRRYEILLCSFLLLIFGNTLTGSLRIMNIADIYQNFLVGLLVFYHKHWLRRLIAAVILLNMALDLWSTVSAIDLRAWHGGLYLLFFFAIAQEVFKKVFYTKKVSREMLSAALCGFVLLCLIGTFLFYLVDMQFPNSFNTMGTKPQTLDSLNYFSFATLLTIGYGDIVPLTMVARRAVMFMGLAGHFYTVFTTSIIIGKYLSYNKEEE